MADPTRRPIIGWRDLAGAIHGLETLGLCLRCGGRELFLRGGVVSCDECGCVNAVIVPGDSFE
jgi:hypothetical protein